MSNPTQHEAAEHVSEERLDAARKAFIKNVKQQDPEWTEDCDEGERLLTSPEGDYFAIDAALAAALRAHDAGQAGVVSEEMVERFRNEFAKGRGLMMPSADFVRRCLTAALSTPPKPSLFGDALAAAGQSIGMSVTRVHPEPEKVGEAVAWLVKRYGNDGSYIGDEVYLKRPDIRSTSRTDFIPLGPMIPSTPPVADARRVEELERALKEAVRGLEMIHGSLMRNGPKQASGELTAHWLETTRAALKGDSNGQ